MSAPVDVVAVLDNLCCGVAPTGHDARMLRTAVAELIEAMGLMLDAFNQPSADATPDELHARRAAVAALARCGGAN